jgi:hypothetical protein
MKANINWDALGITTSVACAIHCALLPLFMSSLPLFGVNIIENTGFEYGMIALAFFVGAYSFYHGFRKHHHSLVPFLLFGEGIGFLLAKMHWHEWKNWLLLPAVASIVTAHFLNFRMCRVHNHAHSDDCNH